ncbi:MAG: hypothetical protein QOJ46_1619 [bacterium]
MGGAAGGGPGLCAGRPNRVRAGLVSGCGHDSAVRGALVGCAWRPWSQHAPRQAGEAVGRLAGPRLGSPARIAYGPAVQADARVLDRWTV